MLAYPTFFCLLCLRAARRSTGSWALSGIRLAWGQWLAASFDVVENVALLNVLLGTASRAWPALAFACAAIKFTLIGLAVLYKAAGWLKRR
jgi:hypothetical protein